ncbi:MAG: alanine--tRNA ligase [Nanoarchaeota archaeon]
MAIKTRQDLIKAYIDFFKKNNHKHIPSASLIPENDPTVLFTTAGMHPLVPYLLGQKHPLGKRLVNVQKCIRTVDFSNIGDTYHHSLFEMLGNWSLGDYWKEEAISLTFKFFTEILGMPIEKLAATCFEGNENAPKDKESYNIYLKFGFSKERIVFLPKETNFWSPAGQTGPCGPNTEIFFWSSKTKKVPKKFNPEDETWIELGNNVLMAYEKTSEGKFIELKQKNIDFGGGMERILAIINGLEDNYLIDCFIPVIKEIEKLSKKKYGKNKENTRIIRIIADHVRSAIFILGDEKGIKPSNTGQGYVLRRLIRRAIRYGKLLGIKENFTHKLIPSILQVYPDYQELHRNHKFIEQELKNEEERFNLTLEKGIKKFQELSSDKLITGKDAFLLFQSYGFPIEFTEELADEKGIKVDLDEYNKEFQRHQDLSRTSSAGMFKSGLADDSEQTRKLHTATHLLNEALRIVLNNKEIKQKGSNITPERLRFDFNFPRKLTDNELKEIEILINKKIKNGLQIIKEEIPLNDAISSGAQHEFGGKYPELVTIYTILDKSEKRGWFSKEFCTGPHVSNTSELGHFKILKEEGVASGIRRIKAVVE